MKQIDVKDLPPFPMSKEPIGLRIFCGMILTPMVIFALWELFSPGQVTEIVLSIGRVCYFAVVVACAIIAFSKWSD